MSTAELAQLAGLSVEELPVVLPDADPGQDTTLRDRFIEQLSEIQGASATHALLAVLDGWSSLGGFLEYGNAASETSCFLMATTASEERIWPSAIYPSGKFEIVFQYLKTRAPFDDPALREELRHRLNKVPGVDLPAAKIELRPGFDLAVLTDPDARQIFLEQLAWFKEQLASDHHLTS